MADKLVKDIMHPGVITCEPDTLLKEVVRILSDTDVSAIIVLGENGEAKGVVSHMDLLRVYGRNLLDVTAKEVMTSEVVSVSPEASITEAIMIMQKRNIHRLLVAEETPEGKKPVGIISTTDVIRDMKGQPWFW
jgi:CBS domain-containing protein